MANRNDYPRRLRFGLRGLLVGTFLLALVFTWFAWQLTEGRRHQRIATQLQAVGCSIQFSHREWVPMASPPASTFAIMGTPMEEKSTLPSFMERLGFADAVRRIDHVTIRERSGLSTALELVKEIGELDTISFYDTDVTQAQLADTLANVHVRKIFVRGEELPRTSMKWLNHDGLTWLCLNRTQLSNPALEDLPESLEYFDATRTRINDEGLKSFVRLKNLKSLNLCRTPTSRNAIDSLRQQMPWCEIKWEPIKQP